MVEAKAHYKTAGDGMQQAKDYASILGLKFAYATNGGTILEFDFITGAEREIATFPAPQELWDRLGCRAGRLVVSSSISESELQPRHSFQRTIGHHRGGQGAFIRIPRHGHLGPQPVGRNLQSPDSGR